MSDKLTPEQVEDFATFPSGSGLGDMARLTIEALSELADSPCPVCVAGDYRYRCGQDGLIYDKKNGWHPCPNCGDYPEDRRGCRSRDWQSAMDEKD